ncbi:MAG: diacylglycerol kinase family protein [Caldilineaceae bacterium]
MPHATRLKPEAQPPLRALKRLGLIVNPRAGQGQGLTIARTAVQALAPAEVLIGSGEMGAAALDNLPCTVHTYDWSGQQGKARTPFLTRRFAQAGIDAGAMDALVVIGGDGTLADVAFALASADIEKAPPLLGIGAGSANVGPLMTCQGDELARLVDAQFTLQPVDALLVSANTNIIGVAFNDVVVSFTVLATVDGELTTVAVSEKMQGENQPHLPEGVWTPATRIVKQSALGEILIAQGEQVETVIVGFPDERFYGKAITGGVLLSGLVNDGAGCLVCSQTLVRLQLDKGSLHRVEPILSRYAGLGDDEWIEGQGFRTGAAICADGNPLFILQPDDRLQVSLRRNLIQSCQLKPRAT